jgi:hypothetical protein
MERNEVNKKDVVFTAHAQVYNRGVFNLVLCVPPNVISLQLGTPKSRSPIIQVHVPYDQPSIWPSLFSFYHHIIPPLQFYKPCKMLPHNPGARVPLVKYRWFNRVEWSLRPTVSRPVCIDVGPPFGAHDQILNFHYSDV